MGQGDRKHSDHAAVEAMRGNGYRADGGRGIIGEGERDEALDALYRRGTEAAVSFPTTRVPSFPRSISRSTRQGNEPLRSGQTMPSRSWRRPNAAACFSAGHLYGQDRRRPFVPRRGRYRCPGRGQP